MDICTMYDETSLTTSLLELSLWTNYCIPKHIIGMTASVGRRPGTSNSIRVRLRSSLPRQNTRIATKYKMSPPPAGSTEAAPLVVEDDQETIQQRLQVLERREQLAVEAEQLARDSGNRILMDGKMVTVFTLDAEASYAALEGPVALASKAELERVLLRICSVSEVARTVATKMLPIATTHAAPELCSGTKRKASEAETTHRCSRCKLRFETDENLPKDCRYHPGSVISISCSMYTCLRPLRICTVGHKDVNYDAVYSDDEVEVWADHCEKTFGPAESMVDYMDYQEGFLWSCCDQRGDADGCQMREHDVWAKRANV